MNWVSWSFWLRVSIVMGLATVAGLLKRRQIAEENEKRKREESENKD